MRSGANTAGHPCRADFEIEDFRFERGRISARRGPLPAWASAVSRIISPREDRIGRTSEVTGPLVGHFDPYPEKWRLNGIPGQLNGADSELNGIPSDLNGVHTWLNATDSDLNGSDCVLNAADSKLNGADSALCCHLGGSDWHIGGGGRCLVLGAAEFCVRGGRPGLGGSM